RVEARERDRVRRVVDDQIATGRLLQGADVAPLAADDATLHVVAGDGDNGDGGLRGDVRGDALDCGGEDLPRPPVRRIAVLRLDLVQTPLGVLSYLALDLGHQQVARLLGRKLRHALNLLQPPLAQLFELLLRLVQLVLASAQALLAPLEGLYL